MIQTLNDLAEHTDYSLINTLTPDPQATENGADHEPREVFSGHYVHVKPTPIRDPQYPNVMLLIYFRYDF